MSISVVLLIVAFLALWLLPALWAMRGPQTGHPKSQLAWTRAVVPLAIYAVLFLAGAWWWHTPLAVQKSVSDFAASPAFALLQVDCAQLNTAMAAAQRASGGMLAVSSEGTLLVDGDLWQGLSSAQREGLAAFARQIAGCAKNGAGAVRIEDAQTGSILMAE